MGLKSRTLLLSCFLNVVQAFAIVVLLSRVPYMTVRLSIPISQFIHQGPGLPEHSPNLVEIDDLDPFAIPDHLSLLRTSSPTARMIELLPQSLTEHSSALDISYPSYAAAVVASKSFTFQPRVLPDNLSILFLNTFADFVERLDRFFYDMVDSAVRHPQLKVYLWGPGYPGFDGSLNATENVIKTYGCDFFDIIYVNVPHFDIAACTNFTVIVQELGECQYGKCLQTYHPNAHVTISRHAYTPLELFNMNVERREAEPHMFAHNPECANPVQPAVQFDQKKFNATLFGSTDVSLFPLRHHVKRGIKFGTVLAEHHGHPGNRIVPPKGSANSMPHRPDHKVPLTADSYTRLQSYVSHIKVANKDYFHKMAHSKICIFDSTVERQAVRKFFEAFLVGCVVASDLPFEMEEEFRDVIIQLDAADSDKAIQAKLASALADPVELRRKAARAMALAHRYFTCHSKVERMLKYVDDYRKGFRGYYFPFGFRIGCHSYLKPYARPNKWCR
mmetsp:Transcript_24596/g.40493  ORF Transcript_24596/g.40493 Transcript_24596/m.40493 type:complete len:503 (-) Transcript_24596:219-1727(-)